MKRLREHLFAFRLVSLALMFLLPVLMYASALLGSEALVWLLLALSAGGAGLLIVVK